MAKMAAMAIMAMAIFNSNMTMICIPQKSTKKLTHWWRDHVNKINWSKVMTNFANQVKKLRFHNVKIAYGPKVKHHYFRRPYTQKSNISENGMQKGVQIQAPP